jgi:hypothetical protein
MITATRRGIKSLDIEKAQARGEEASALRGQHAKRAGYCIFCGRPGEKMPARFAVVFLRRGPEWGAIAVQGCRG